VCGTGLKECILSGLLSVKGKKVLHLDRNSYYGADTASLNLTNLWAMFRPGVEPPKEYGHNRDWNVDLIPKFIMADGKLVKMLLHTKVTRYLEWKCVDASYVMQYQKGGMFANAKNTIHKVPATDVEGLKSSLMGLFEKKRLANFYKAMEKIVIDDPKTWGDFDLKGKTFADLYKKYGLEANTIDFLGHAVALELDDDYLNKPAIDTIPKMKLYADSMGKYGLSPFLYPVYGLGGLPESFSRLCAIHGGTYMLNTPVDSLLFENGKVVGIQSGENTAKAPLVICDPSYVKDQKKTKVVGKTIRTICILDHPIPNTNDVPSIQIILPQKQLNRKSDVYITMVSNAHAVCAKDLYIAIISATVETDSPQKEIEPAIQLLGTIKEMFTMVSDLHVPINDWAAENLHITSSYDATSHFETSDQEVLSIYERIVGEKFDLNIQPSEEEDY
jgi:Rab GDP dissociation inhibitor